MQDAGFVFSDAANLRCSWYPLAVSLCASAAVFMPAMRSELKAALAVLLSMYCQLLRLSWRLWRKCVRCVRVCGRNRRAAVAPQPLPTPAEPDADVDESRRSTVYWRSRAPWRLHHPQHPSSCEACTRSGGPQQQQYSGVHDTVLGSPRTASSSMGLQPAGFDNLGPVCFYHWSLHVVTTTTPNHSRYFPACSPICGPA